MSACAAAALTAILGLAVACSSAGATTTAVTPAPRTTRVPPEVLADPLPPLSKFVTQADGTQVSTVSADYLFEQNSAELLPDAVTALGQIVPDIREHPGRIQVVGYSDGLGATDSNLDLSRRRAEAVRDFLVTEDIPASVLGVEARGEEGAQDDVADASRRKVEIILR